MATGTHLFTVPIPALGAHPGGTIVATEPAPAVYLLTITSPADNRLTTVSCGAMLDALDLIEFGGYAPGVVVTTSGIPKFYSNGLDLEHALANDRFIPGSLYKLFNRLLTCVSPLSPSLLFVRRFANEPPRKKIATPCPRSRSSPGTPSRAGSCWRCTTTTGS